MIKMTIGGVPVTQGWRFWNSTQRPDPGRWFFEARYHHSGHWKVGLDFRPVDGAFPAFWQPPFIWKYATEIEDVEKALGLPVEKWGYNLLKVHPSNHTALAASVVKYGAQAKQKKLLLFGAADGIGAKEHKIKAGEGMDPTLYDGGEVPDFQFEVKGHDLPWPAMVFDSMSEMVSKRKFWIRVKGVYQPNGVHEVWRYTLGIVWNEQPELTFEFTWTFADPQQLPPQLKIGDIKLTYGGVLPNPVLDMWITADNSTHKWGVELPPPLNMKLGTAGAHIIQNKLVSS